MGRFALIIESSDVCGLDDLPGARKDAQNWCQFLISNAGGGWSPDEILTLHKPTSGYVSMCLEQHRQDYCFVAYSGHGCEIRSCLQEKGLPAICLNDNEKMIPLALLKPKGPNGTLISDSCRGIETSSKTATFSESARCIALSADGIDIRMQHRNVWDNALAKCCTQNSGVLTMYSCASGQSADEDPNAGGVYTSLLIGYAREWYYKAEKNYYFTTWHAHVDAAQRMRANYPQQTPQYETLPLVFPFAVKA